MMGFCKHGDFDQLNDFRLLKNSLYVGISILLSGLLN